MIPFRTQRLATSVTNRLLNIHAGLPPRVEPGEPAAPEPSPEGQELDQKLNAPKGGTDADPADANAIALSPLAK